MCQLHHANNPDSTSLTQQAVYHALSYAWGPEWPKLEITLGAWSVLVRKNLWHFLRQRRQHGDRALLWIDALCIDQSDLGERASQVQLMDRIYKRAQKVLTWLGLSDSDDVAAMDLIRTNLGSSATKIRQSSPATMNC